MTLRAGIRDGLAAAALLAAASVAASAAEPPAPAVVREARDAVFARPEFDYGTAEKKPSLLRELLVWWQSLLQEFQERHPVLFVVVVAAAGVALVVLVAHMVWTWRVARRTAYSAPDPRDLEAALRRLDPAPFRARAAEHARAGRLDEALRDLYVALLLTLDRRGALRYAGHKALLDYRFEAAGDAGARAALDQFADDYPPGSFGRRPPDAERYAALSAVVDALSGARR